MNFTHFPLGDLTYILLATGKSGPYWKTGKDVTDRGMRSL